MKFIKCFSVLALSAVLAACGGHGFEGEYESKIDGSKNVTMNAIYKSLKPSTLTIGSDYVESQGQRQLYDEIFVRKSGDQKYLVFKKGSSEEAMKIADGNTLVQENGIMNIQFVKIK